jgi:hypothetical protein
VKNKQIQVYKSKKILMNGKSLSEERSEIVNIVEKERKDGDDICFGHSLHIAKDGFRMPELHFHAGAAHHGTHGHMGQKHAGLKMTSLTSGLLQRQKPPKMVV